MYVTELQNRFEPLVMQQQKWHMTAAVPALVQHYLRRVVCVRHLLLFPLVLAAVRCGHELLLL